jgi:NAD(P)-dependent dehydrogenase (short-subunit alcohol dehydrogenase family)
MYLSSVSASLTPPWPGLACYTVSKAALDKLVEAWRAEHPQVGFTRFVVGDCAGGEGDGLTQFANGWDMEVGAALMPTWMERGYMNGGMIDVEHLVQMVDAVARAGASATIPTITFTPRAPTP